MPQSNAWFRNHALTSDSKILKAEMSTVAVKSEPLPLNARAASGRWWRLADVAVFGAWLAVVGTVVKHHEPWADEAQSWLLARDLDLKTLWFHELRYEGSPGLWQTILWAAQRWFHAPYASLGMIGMLCAAAGVAFILWKSPFPRPVSYLLVFSYFISYQYAVVSRSYNLLPLLVFAAAYLYRDRDHPVRMTVVLILLANVAIHGILFAASLGLCYLLEAVREWSALDKAVRRRYFYCIAAMLATLIFLVIILMPTPDVKEFAASRPSVPLKLRFELAIGFTFLDQLAVSSLFLLVAGIWCFRRKHLLPFVLSLALLLSLFIMVHGVPHHSGTIFLAALSGLWIAWPTREESQHSSPRDRLATLGMSALLFWLLSVNTWDAAAAMRNDYLYSYSGSADAARYLKQVGADKTTIFGYRYGVSAVEAYFDHNILENMPTTYYHEGMPLTAAFLVVDELAAAAPEYVVLYSNAGSKVFRTFDPQVRALGYSTVHVSRGRIFFKRFVFDTDDYYIYRRAGSGVVR